MNFVRFNVNLEGNTEGDVKFMTELADYIEEQIALQKDEDEQIEEFQTL